LTDSPLTILVVEDDDLVLRTMVALLERENYRVQVARNGAEGLMLAARVEPDVVLLDLMMPELNGFQFLRQLRQSAQKELPVVVVSARTDPVNAYWAKRLGADDFVHKPFTARQLVGAVEAQRERLARQSASAISHQDPLERSAI
jgi:two-component system response regulator VicR